MANVELKKVKKVYDKDVLAIKGADVSIKDKEFVVLVGPSGCGKSTLLRMIAGLEEISEGDLYIDEKRVNDLSPKDRDIAMVFQNYALYPHMTVFDNMAFGLKLRKYPKAEIKQRVEHAASILGLTDYLKRRPKEMSGGQRQRVAIGRALVRQPKVFLFDEPLSNLDAKLRVQMRIEIKRLHQQLQATMIYVTHDQIEAMTMGDKIVVLKDGIVQQVDSPMNLFNDPANKFVAGFIGSPSMNFLEGKIEKGAELEFASGKVRFGIPDELQLHDKLNPYIGKNIIFGFRPEYMYDKNHEKHKQLSVDLSLIIDVVEPVGSEAYNYFHFEGQEDKTFCFRSDSALQYQSNQQITVGMDDAYPMFVKEVILNGVFDRYKRGRVSNILQGFNPFDIEIAVDQQTLNLENCTHYTQCLDMQQATFASSFETEKVRVKHDLCALRNLPFSALVTVELEAKADVEMTFFNHIKAPSHLSDVQNFYSEIDRPHVKIPLLTSVAQSPSGALTLAVANSYLFEEPHGEEPQLIHEDWDFNRHLVKFYKKLEKGQTYRISLVSSMGSTVHFSDPQNEVERLSIFAKLEGWERLMERHSAAWEELWKSDIKIEGDPQTQREVRLMLYYLYASARAGSALSLSPCGLSGLGYNGHVFWDTELWMFPPLLLLQPDIARSLLDYRFDRLEAARQNAFTHGYKGAMFPWESADDGSEQTPVWALTGPFQQHITACVGWAFWKYYQATQDRTWLHERGYPVLKEVAAFWCSRVERKGPGRYEINNVIGANEFEENIDNNAFTNGIVKTVLRNAAQAATLLKETPDPDWLHVADNIPILQFEDGTTRENRTYEGAIIKQADVNLLAHPLEVISDEEQIRKDLDFYEPRMSPDGPAMGFATLATLRAQLGEVEQAYAIFIRSYRSNGVPPFGVLAECADGRGVSPYFTTGAGGALQAVLFGFGGYRFTDEGVKKGEGRLPKAWRKLTISRSW
ncbi:MAG: sn-glycerol-3-phosphate ABC transporter ATP-binding protein UgpC [Bacteroidota bacterium]